ncbi:MAG: hypothetical protein IKJ43_04480 [Bacilli bacterium]|nr:hypothetical protein [Bacilli bacterium]
MKCTLNEHKNKPYKIVTNYLKVQDYCFEISGEDIDKCQITYSFDNYKSVLYDDGKEVETKIKPLISIELSGFKEKEEASISLSLGTDIETLNKYPSKPIEITDMVIDGESFIKYPKEKLIGFLDLDRPKNNIDDMYINYPSIWFYKISKNIFMFKVVIPNSVFAYFKVDFNEEVDHD